MAVSFFFIHLLKWFTGIFTWGLILFGWITLMGFALTLILWTRPDLFGHTINKLASDATITNKDLTSV